MNYKLKFNFRFDKSGLGAINWRPFWAGLIAGIIISIIMTVFSYLNFPSLEMMISPLPKVDFIEKIRPKLHKKFNDFKLNNKIISVPNAYADAFGKQLVYGVIDYDTGKIIAQNGLNQKQAIASLTKIMTAVVALDLASPEEFFYISNHAARQIPTKIGVRSGERMNLTELLYASLMTLANDATEVIKEGIDYKYGGKVFIAAMNEKASFLGLEQTHFTNAQGFDNPGNFSTVSDLAVLAHYALTNYSLISEIVKKDYQFIPADNNHKQFDLYNWNGLLGVYPNTLGVKIGNTEDAGTTTIVLSERQGKKIMAILLHAPDVLNRDLIAGELLDLGFEESLNLPKVALTIQDLQTKYATWKYWN